MSRCRLGAKRVRQLEAIVGRGIDRATVRGGEPHGRALCWMQDGDVVWANWMTGETFPTSDFYRKPWWGTNAPPPGCALAAPVAQEGALT